MKKEEEEEKKNESEEVLSIYLSVTFSLHIIINGKIKYIRMGD
jgi:hypothetical protein